MDMIFQLLNQKGLRKDRRMTTQQKMIKWMLLLFGVFFLLFGIIFLAGGMRTEKTMDTVKATITSVKKETKDVIRKHKHRTTTVYRVTVDYTYDGVEYRDVACPFGSSSMKEGQILDIKIDPNAPKKPQSASVLFLIGGIMSLAAIMFFVFFGIILATEKRQEKNR